MLFISDTLLPILPFQSCRVSLLQSHVQMFVVSHLALSVSLPCLVPLLSVSGSPWPWHLRPHHKRQQCARKCQMTRPASHQPERGQGPAGQPPRHAGEEKCCASALTLLLSMSGKCFTLQVEAREQEKHPADLCKKFWISNIYLWNLLNIPIYFSHSRTEHWETSLCCDWNLIRETGKPTFQSYRRQQAGKPRLKWGKGSRQPKWNKDTAIKPSKGKTENTPTIFYRGRNFSST